MTDTHTVAMRFASASSATTPMVIRTAPSAVLSTELLVNASTATLITNMGKKMESAQNTYIFISSSFFTAASPTSSHAISITMSTPLATMVNRAVRFPRLDAANRKMLNRVMRLNCRSTLRTADNVSNRR